MAESNSKEVYFLKQVSNQKYNKDFAVNLAQVNNTLTSISKYLLVMQNGIDDLNKDIFEQIQDFINELIIIFNGGDFGELGLDWGDLKYVLQAIGGFFGFDIWGGTGDAWNPIQMVTNFFENFLSGIPMFGDVVGNIIDGVIDFIVGLFSWIPGVGSTGREKLAGAINESYEQSATALSTAESVQQTVADHDAIISDHSNSINELSDSLSQLILQGTSLVFTSNNTYTPPDDIISLDVIVIGAGAGGGGAKWDVVAASRRAGVGGGGGGETHCNIPAALLPKSGGHFLPINITIGAGGSGGVGDAASGSGGGDSWFGDWIRGGGGNGGGTMYGSGVATSSYGGEGGVGMIPGGKGGIVSSLASQIMGNGGASVSSYDLHGGGGGGGAGFIGNTVDLSPVPGRGGQGGISPGGGPGQNGEEPADILATGGGGGGGAPSTGSSLPGNGAFPAGGGGGASAGIASKSGPGGNGANAIVYVIERTS